MSQPSGMLGNMGQPLEWRRSEDSIQEVSRSTVAGTTTGTEQSEHAEHIELEDLQVDGRANNGRAEVEPFFQPVKEGQGSTGNKGVELS